MIKNKKSFYHQAQIEIGLLEHMNRFDVPERSFVVEYQGQFLWRNHLCLCFELLSFNLYDLLKNTGFQGVSLNLVRKFGQQLLSALFFLSSPNIDILHWCAGACLGFFFFALCRSLSCDAERSLLTRVWGCWSIAAI